MPRVSTYPDATTPLNDTDITYVVQGGNSRKATVDDLFTAPAFDAEVNAKLNATGAAPTYACRAWVNFNGTGTVAIRAQGNVSSITDNGVGDYTINFTTALPDANYAATAVAGGTAGVVIGIPVDDVTPRTTTALRIRTINTGFALTDAAVISVAIFR
jgi:hypothetical protein